MACAGPCAVIAKNGPFPITSFAAAVREDDPVVEGIVDNRSPSGIWSNTPIAPLTINHKEATTRLVCSVHTGRPGGDRATIVSDTHAIPH